MVKVYKQALSLNCLLNDFRASRFGRKHEKFLLNFVKTDALTPWIPFLRNNHFKKYFQSLSGVIKFPFIYFDKKHEIFRSVERKPTNFFAQSKGIKISRGDFLLLFSFLSWLSTDVWDFCIKQRKINDFLRGWTSDKAKCLLIIHSFLVTSRTFQGKIITLCFNSTKVRFSQFLHPFTPKAVIIIINTEKILDV